MHRLRLAPPQDWQFNERDYARFQGRFWRCPLRLVQDGIWARLWRPDGRPRGRGAATSLLPVLAVHAYPEQSGAEAGWTAWVPLSRRRMARLSGLDKDTATAALRTLSDAGLVEVQQRRRDEGDPRTSTWLRLRADAYPSGGEPYLVYPAEAAYSGYWAGLPGEAFRHLLIAWAAVPPDRVCSAQKLAAVEGELGATTGMGRTAVRKAAGALLAWRGPQGARLVVRHGDEQNAHVAPPRAVAAAARRSGALPRPARVKPGPRRPEPPQVPDGRPPALEGAASFEARKVWWLKRYLGRWAAGKLRRGPNPVYQAVYVDLAPGEPGSTLPEGLAAACWVARRVSGPTARAGDALRVFVVEPDRSRRARLVEAATREGASIEFFPDEPEAFLQRVVPHRTEREAAQRAPISLLFFLGSAEAPAVGAGALRGVAAGAREAVALTRGGDWESPQARLWQDGSGNGPGAGPVERLAEAAIRNGARRVLSVPLHDATGAPAGTLLHLAGTPGASVTLKASLTPKVQPATPGFTPLAWLDLPGTADQIARRFAGRRIRWSGPRVGDTWEDRVRAYLLRDTPLLGSDLAAVRREMVWRGWRVEARPAIFEFPKATSTGSGRVLAEPMDVKGAPAEIEDEKARRGDTFIPPAPRPVQHHVSAPPHPKTAQTG